MKSIACAFIEYQQNMETTAEIRAIPGKLNLPQFPGITRVSDIILYPQYVNWNKHPVPFLR